MEELFLFGLALDVDGSDVKRPVAAGVEVEHWQAVLDANVGELAVEAWLHLVENYTFALKLNVSVRKVAEGRWTVSDGSQPQDDEHARYRLIRGLQPYPGHYDPDGYPPIMFQAGPFYEEIESFSADPLFGDEGLRLNLLEEAILSDLDLPLALHSGSGGAIVNLSRLTIELGANFFDCETRSTLTVPIPGLIAQFFLRRWRSVETEIPLRSGSGSCRIGFLPEFESQDLPIAVDLLDRAMPPSEQNLVVPAQCLSGGRLDVLFGEETSLRIEDVWYHPELGRTIGLDANYLALPGGMASYWIFDSRVPLHIRSGHDGRPSTFVVAPMSQGILARQPRPDGPLHGPIRGAEFHISGEVELQCLHREAQSQVGPHIHPSIASENTSPFLLEQRSSRVVHSKPGQTYRSPASNADQNGVVAMEFTGSAIGVPLTPDAQLKHYPNLRSEAYAYLDELAEQELRPSLMEDAVHETLLSESSPTGDPEELKVIKLFGGVQTTNLQELLQSTGSALRLADHKIKRSYGGIEVEHFVAPEDTLDYVLLFRDEMTFGDSKFNFRPDPRIDIILSNSPTGVGGGTNKLLGILKLSTVYDLEEILDREKNRIAQTAGSWDWEAFLRDTLKDEVIKSPGWLGMLLFETPIDIDAVTVLRSMVQNDLKLSYLALTPEKDNSTGFSISARVRRVVDSSMYPAPNTGDELRFRLSLLDMTWQDSALVNFRTEAALRVTSIFGEPNDNEPEIRIVGSFDAETKTFRFLGELPYEHPVFPEDSNFGPIQQVYIRSAEIVDSSRGARLNIDGRIELRPFTMAGANWFEGASGQEIRFRDLGLWIPKANSPDWRWLRVDYPSLRLTLDGPQFRLLDVLDLKITGFGVDWPNLSELPHVPWDELAKIWEGDDFSLDKPVFHTGLRLDLMQLPELVARSLERLRFDFTLGFNPSPYDESKLRVYLAAVDFERLNLELLRFLTVKALGVKMEAHKIDVGNGPESVPRFDFADVSVEILGKKLIDSLDLVLYSLPDGRTCFVSRILQPVEIGLLEIEWVLIGQNMKIPDRLAEDLLSIKPAGDNAAVADTINDFWYNGGKHNGFLPMPEEFEPRGVTRGEWIFGAGFKLADGILTGKFLFQDNRYYGIALDGAWLREWFGWKFAISVLYIVGDRPEKDRFVVSMRVPSVTLAAFQFFGGVIRVDIDMRGRFLLDIGFPWMRKNGSREWDRVFGAIVTPFQGTGGSYFANGLSRADVPDDVLLLGGGIAVQFGFGGAFGGSVFRVWATAGIYFVVEGEFYLLKSEKDLIGARLSGAVGILVRAGGELNWWIISVRVEVVVSAEAQMVVTWAWQPGDVVPVMLPGAGTEGTKSSSLAPLTRSQAIEARISFVLYARASARACIGSGWFKVCKGISVTVPLRYDCRFKLA